jgi:hypothetical protein
VNNIGLDCPCHGNDCLWTWTAVCLEINSVHKRYSSSFCMTVTLLPVPSPTTALFYQALHPCLTHPILLPPLPPILAFSCHLWMLYVYIYMLVHQYMIHTLNREHLTAFSLVQSAARARGMYCYLLWEILWTPKRVQIFMYAL